MFKNRFMKIILIGCAIFFFILSLRAQNSDTDRPNIIIILADDLGYGSINSYGASKELVRTPNLNRLAEEGMTFTDASTPASICTPTRVGLLTGQYPWRTSLKSGVTNPLDPLLLNPEDPTLADVLNDQGYQTAAIGKWHLGYGNEKPVDFTKKLTPGPLDLGFDYHFGVPQNHGDMWGVYVENDHIYKQRSTQVTPHSRTFYGPQYVGIDAPHRINKDVTRELAEKAVDWIKGLDHEKPFFLYFAAVAVHKPITPSDEMRGLSGSGPYGDFIQDLDMSVGRILEVLEYMNLSDNTLIIFTSDNGGQIPSNDDTAPEIYAKNLGLKANGKHRGDKHTIWEGGTKVPFIAKWTDKIQPGSKCDNMINIVDIFSSVHEIVEGKEADLPNAGRDSFSFLSNLLQTDNSPKRKTMITADVNGMHAIRIGDWKYIDNKVPESLSRAKAQKLIESFVPQLYNLAQDPEEKNNLYSSNKKMVNKLSKELEALRAKTSK